MFAQWKFTVSLAKYKVKDAGNVSKWCWLLKRFSTNMHGEEQSGCQSLVMDDLKEKSAKCTHFAQQTICNFPHYAKCLNLHANYVQK
jgi:hypothetical protein